MRSYVLGLITILSLGFSGCGGGGGGGAPASPPPSSPPTVASFSASPASISTGQTSTLSWSVSGANSLAIDHGVGTVSGINVGVSPAATTTYTLSATNSVGTTSATTTVTVNAAPSFTLVENPSALSIAAGSSGSATVAVNAVNGFTGAVALSLTGAPAGVTATFTPNPSTTLSSFALQVASPVPTGTYPLVIHGIAPGLPEQTANLSFTVSPGSVAGTTITWELCFPFQTVLWFAVQDGNGPWQVVQPVNGNYTFQVASGKAGLALVLDGGALKTLNLFYATTAEFQQKDAMVSLQNFLTCNPLASVSGSIAGQNPVSDFIPLGMGEAGTMVVPGQSTFTLTTLKSGVKDLMASTNWLDTANPLAPVWRTSKILLRRSITVPVGGLTGLALDFNSDGFTPIQRTATIQGLGANEIAVGMGCFYSTTALFAGYTTQGNSTLMLGNGQGFPFAGVPPERQQNGDVHGLGAVAAPILGPAYNADNTRFIQHFFKTASDQTLTIPGAHPLPTVQKLTGTPYLRPQVAWTVTAPFTKFWSFSGFQGSPTPTRSYAVMMTAGYAGGATSLSHILPDFTGLAGWDPTWAPQDGVPLQFGFNASGWTSTTSTLGPARVDGEAYTQAFRRLVFTP